MSKDPEIREPRDENEIKTIFFSCPISCHFSYNYNGKKERLPSAANQVMFCYGIAIPHINNQLRETFNEGKIKFLLEAGVLVPI